MTTIQEVMLQIKDKNVKKELSNLTLLNSFTKIVSSTLFDKDPKELYQIRKNYERYMGKEMKR